RAPSRRGQRAGAADHPLPAECTEPARRASRADPAARRELARRRSRSPEPWQPTRWRSEERRVGKECRSGGSPAPSDKTAPAATTPPPRDPPGSIPPLIEAAVSPVGHAAGRSDLL